MATLDLLGEEVSERSTRHRRDRRVRAHARRHRRARRCPPTSRSSSSSLGLKIDAGFCRDNVERIVAAAARHGNFVRIDMEDHTTTDATLRDLPRHLRPPSATSASSSRPTCGARSPTSTRCRRRRQRAALQGDLHRAADDRLEGLRDGAAELPRARSRSSSSRGVYVGIATHDEHLACGAVALVDRLEVSAGALRVPDAARRRPGAAPDPARRRPPPARLRALRPRLVPYSIAPPAREPGGRDPRPQGACSVRR